MKISCVDLFCGAGGLTHGLQQGGVKVVAGVDLDPHCRYPYEQNNKGDFIQKDVSEISADDLQKMWGTSKVTMLAGCAPCQPFSTYSRKSRKTRPDSKWELVAEFGRLVRESQPSLVTMENVPQLLDHSVIEQFKESLTGYHVWQGIVECSEYGIPQTRKRLVLLASRLGPISLLPPKLVDETTKSSVRIAISGLPALNAGQADPFDNLHRACRLSPLNLKRIKVSTPGGTWREWDAALVAKCHQKKTGETYPSVYGRMEWDAPSPTITTQCFGFGNGRFGHPEQHRAITLREAAMLQTFPRSYKFVEEGGLVRFNILGRLIGNAVPVRLGEVVAKSLVSHIADVRRDERNRRRRVAKK